MTNRVSIFFTAAKRSVAGKFVEFFNILKENEKQIINYRPTGWVPIQWFEKKFYPPNKGKFIASADKFFIPIVVISLLTVLIEDKLELDFPGSKVGLSTFFLIIFGAEFILRLYVKGWKYFWPWGVIDIVAMAGDIIFILAWVYSDGSFGEEWAFWLRILRFARFIRLLRYLTYVSLIKAKVARLLLYGQALAKVLIIVTGLIALPAFIGYAFFDADIKALIIFIGDQLGINEWLSKINSATNGKGEKSPEELAKHTGILLNDVYRLMIIVITFFVMNMITLLFAPMARQIAQTSQDSIIDKILNDHIIIYVHEDHDLLEELIYVFEKYTQKQVVYILNAEERFETPFPSGALTRRGDFDSRNTWTKVNASLANTILFFNTPDVEAIEVVHTIIDPENALPTLPRFIQVNNDCQPSHHTAQLGEQSLTQTNISINKLRDVLSDTIWNYNTIQHAFYTDLIDDWDEKFVFPSNLRVNDAAYNLDDIELDTVDTSWAKLRLQDNNLLVEPPDDDKKSDSYRVLLVRNLIENTALADITRQLNVFCFVNDFYLFDFNKEFQKNQNHYVCIVAAEFAIALAVLHEMQCYGSSQAWIIDANETAERLVPSEPSWWGSYRSRDDFETNDDALCSIKANGEIHCFKEDSHRILIEEGDGIIFFDQNGG